MIWFIAGAGLAYVVTVVFMGTLLQQQAERIRSLQATLFAVEQDLLMALEGQQYPKYVLRSDGVDAVVERNRPDLSKERGLGHPQAADGTQVLDLTAVEDE